MHAPVTFRHQLIAAMPRLRRYARSLRFDVHHADDLVQTALERALSRWHQFDQRRDMAGWLLSIAHNAHLDERRRAARLRVVEPSWLDEELDRFAGRHDVPDPGLRIDLLGALQRLCREQRDALLLVGVEQLSYAEAADVLRVPVGTVMSRVFRARTALRRLLDGGDEAGGACNLRRVV